MSFNSVHFLIFLLIVLVGHWLLPHKFRWIWLLIASYYFYMSWNAWPVFMILGTTCVSYAAGFAIHKAQKRSTKKLLLATTIIVCLGLLAFFKYFNFLMQSAIDFLNLFALKIDSFAMEILLPIGISFYTFQTLSYVIDIYRDKIVPEKHFGYYALFVSFFPQLVAGPIERPDNLLPQLRAQRNASQEDFIKGFRLMLIGFFKKIVVADFIGTFVNSAFNNVGLSTGFSMWIASILFLVQVYCDFSGYSDIAIGCSRMMGIKLMKNFDRPFLSTSMREYNYRWHISLNSWFREYLYFPLGGSRKGKLRKYFNIILVFTISGLWHGARWTFIIWGAIIGVYMVIEDLLRPLYHKLCDKLHIDNNNELVKVLRRIIVVLLISTSMVFFRAQTLSDAIIIISKMFTDLGVGAKYIQDSLDSLSINIIDIIQLGFSLALLCVGFTMYRPKEHGLFSNNVGGRSALALQSSAYFYYIALIAIAWIIVVANNDASAFIYFQF